MGLKLVRKPRTPKVQQRIIREEVRQKLKPVVKIAQQSYERVVSNWENKPEFGTRIIVTSDKIQALVTLKRSGAKKLRGSSNATTADLWKWIDQTGTKAHPIPKQPKTRGALRFTWGGPGSYQSKTGARPARFGGPGVVQRGETVYRKQVQHPGFPPRKFSEAIGKDLRPQFNRAIDAGYRSGFRKATR